MKAATKAQKKVQKKTTEKSNWVAVSGGFDPIHIGHVRMFEKAKKLCDKLAVIINNDNWLLAKKGYVFMHEKERKEIIASFPSVDKVILTSHTPSDPDRSVCRELAKLKPAIFANGGDRKPDGDPVPEVTLCKELGIELVYNIGKGGKVQSSSWLARDASRNFARSVRPWGEFYGWDSGKEWKLKTIYVKAGQRLSLQYHHHRTEHWVLVEGDATATFQKPNGTFYKTPLEKGEVIFVDRKAVHRLESERGGVIVEVGLGDFDENDIVRLEDDHGRAEEYPLSKKGQSVRNRIIMLV
jgi:cytidyltransferase-like protein